ncbi:helix-turn-helix domain-containing protein [Nocardioides conyzicola]|uniref:HTH cro/C1-type domain-containing protein n=1 Tax=Nocardioides conyzicola TaxID=1651781 RepID=A0ABP8WQF5_9ACTN
MTTPANEGQDEAAIAVALGRSIAAARAARQLSMRAVATQAGISQPFLSQIENGRTMPSLLTLYRIATALGLSPAELMPAEPESEPVHLVRRGEGPVVRVSEAPNAGSGRLVTAAGARTVISEYRVTPDQDLGDWFRSDGELVVYVADGRIAVTIDGRGEWELDAGDTITYSGDQPNVWRVLGPGPATILLVYSPDL